MLVYPHRTDDVFLFGRVERCRDGIGARQTHLCGLPIPGRQRRKRRPNPRPHARALPFASAYRRRSNVGTCVQMHGIFYDSFRGWTNKTSAANAAV